MAAQALTFLVGTIGFGLRNRTEVVMQHVNIPVVVLLWLGLALVPQARYLPEKMSAILAFAAMLPITVLALAIVAESLGLLSLHKWFGPKR